MKRKVFFLASMLSVVALTGCGQPEVQYDYTYNTYLQTKPKTWNTHNWESNDEAYITSFTEMGFYDLALNETNDGYVIVNEMAAAYPVDVTEEAATREVRELYGYTGNLSDGYIWDIELNPNAKWENGTPITANDYVESMKRQLDPKLVNFRADSYYASSFVIANAERYFKQGRSTLEPLYDYMNDDGSFNTADILSNGYYYFNLGVYTPYVKEVFSNADETTTFYTVLNNRSTTASDTIELAAQRITDACKYYAWAYCDHTGDFEADWAEIEGYSQLSSVTEEMLVPYYINIDDFDNNEVYVRSVINQSGDEYKELYGRDAFVDDLTTFVTGISRGSGKTSLKAHAWKCPLFGYYYNDYESTFESVGLKAEGDYKLRLFLGKPTTKLDLQFGLTSNWLVKNDLYDSLIVTTGDGMKATGYATPDKGTSGYMSYGPYKLATFEAGKSFKIVKNDQWYGYTDGKHVDQYKMECLYTRIIEDHNTAKQEFLAGRLDDFSLNRTDMKDYGHSSRLTSTYESYTQKISFNSDYNSLKTRQENGKNKTVISNIDFRKGLSLALDRNDFASKATAGSKGFTGLLNDLYLTDVESGEMYRNTTQGKSVYNQVYGDLGGTPSERQPLDTSANGYNYTMGTYYVAQAMKAELESTTDGHLKANDTITLEFRVYDNESETTLDAMHFLEGAFSNVIASAVALLKTEEYEYALGANETIEFDLEVVKDEDYYNSAQKGNYDLIFSTWGGAAINPIGLMQVYCDSTFTSCCEYGFKGKQDKTDLWIDLNGDGEASGGETKTFNAWWSEISNIAETDERDTPAWHEKHNKILTVLAGLEAGILNRFEAVPVVARASASLNSYKIENGTTSYINLIGYGGIRHLKFNYSNSEWETFLNEHGDNLADYYKN